MTHVLYTKKQLVEEVQNVFQAWRNEKPDTRTVAHLSREAGVTDSAVRRLLNQNTKISDDMLYSILLYIAGNQSFEKMVSKYQSYPSISAWINKHYSYLLKAPVKSSVQEDSVASIIYQNPIMFGVYMFISSIPNVTSDFIKEQFGLRGEKELEHLISIGLVTADGDGYVAKQKDVMFSKEQTVALLPDITRTFLKKDHDHNSYLLRVDGISKEGYIKLMGIFDILISQTCEIISSNPGDIPVVFCSFMDSFSVQPYFG